MRTKWMQRGVWAAAAMAAFAGTAWGGAAVPFEGKVTYQITRKQGPAMEGDYVYKNGLLRVETKVPGAPQTYTIINPAEKKMLMVMPAQRMVMEMVMSNPPETPNTVAPTKPEITKTDRTEQVTFNSEGTKLTLVKPGGAAGAGAKTYEGVQWLMKTPQATIEQWITKDLKVGGFPGMAGPGSGGGYGPVAGPGSGGGYIPQAEGTPYKVVMKDANGNVVLQMTLMGIDTKPPEDALFKVPADYKKTKMPVMPQMPKQ